MQFRLLYEGPIGPRQRINAEDIHRIRMALHPKLKALWQYKPLSDFAHQLRETTRPEEVAIYVPTNHVCMDYEPFRVSYTAGQPYVAATLSMYPPPGESNMGNFIAWDGKTGKIVCPCRSSSRCGRVPWQRLEAWCSTARSKATSRIHDMTFVFSDGD